MKLAWLLVALTACQAAEEDRHVLPGGDDGESTTPGGGDAGIRDAPPGDGSAILGRVCLLSDLRNLAGCAATGADGLTVTLGGQMATTAADGTFTMPAPSGSTLVWRVTGPGVVPSRMSFSVVPLIPVVPQSFYDDLALSNGVIINAGQGAVVARLVTPHGAGVPGGTGTIVAATYPAFYDGSSASQWNQSSTGTQ
ncbi:hypothetical protein BH11MYX3_BH11MYX3_23800 [soil metagenome]